MAPNSLFAILLRSQWWISIAIAAVIAVLSQLLLPTGYVIVGAVAALPFLGIGLVRAWRQAQQPSAARISGTVAALGALGWSEFADLLEQGLRRDGYSVERLDGRSAADFRLIKAGRISLMSGKRWKAARTGIEPLRELQAMADTGDAHDCIYVATGQITDQARRFAGKHRIRIFEGPQLAPLLQGLLTPARAGRSGSGAGTAGQRGPAR
ncbi:MAG: restriction endonuclease [Burkholderiaceae bacterium]